MSNTAETCTQFFAVKQMIAKAFLWETEIDNVDADDNKKKINKRYGRHRAGEKNRKQYKLK